MSSRTLLAALTVGSICIAACGGSESASAPETASAPATEAMETEGIRVVSPEAAAATIENPPADLVILDVRTPEEFAEGHIEGAVLLDFYRDDFADELAEFDTDVPYVLYCRSGNRSSQARSIMDELDFRSVEDVDGGIVGWQEAGLPVVTG